VSLLQGRWGSIEGANAIHDAERAVKELGIMLRPVLVELLGAPSPVEPSFGMVPLVLATATITAAARIELLNEVLQRLSEMVRARRRDPASKSPDLEAICLEASSKAVQRISDHQAAIAAAEAAAVAAVAASMGSRPPLQATAIAGQKTALDMQPGGDPKKPKATRQKEKRAAAAAAAPTAPHAPAPPAAPAAAPAAPRQPGQVKVKQEPIDLTKLKKGAGISVVLDRMGGGLVEIIDRLHSDANPGTPVQQLPCPWAAGPGKCRAALVNKCGKCTFGAQPDAAVLSAAKALCTPGFLATLPTDAPMVMAN
jgi:chemotaxis protein histidine kinase CheA